jgi:metal-sulfur cluster biosynthetic enzyme
MDTGLSALSLVERRQDEVYQQLKRVIDPELGMSVVKLGLVYDISVQDDAVTVTMTLTARGCPLGDAITRGVEAVVAELPWVDQVSVRIVWDPPWNPTMIR